MVNKVIIINNNNNDDDDDDDDDDPYVSALFVVQLLSSDASCFQIAKIENITN